MTTKTTILQRQLRDLQFVQLADAAKSFTSTIRIECLGVSADAKSPGNMASYLRYELLQGNTVSITATGADEVAAIDKIMKLFDEAFS